MHIESRAGEVMRWFVQHKVNPGTTRVEAMLPVEVDGELHYTFHVDEDGTPFEVVVPVDDPMPAPLVLVGDDGSRTDAWPGALS